MFKSKRRNIVTPQSEHLKLVGTLAMLWGNDRFDSPPIERDSIIMGMGLHDRGYGYLDNSPIGSIPDEEWDVIARRGFDMECSNIVADTIVKYHFRRLAGHGTSEIRKKLHADFTDGIDAQLKKHNLSRLLFDRMDRITDLLDTLSFQFCFDVPVSGRMPVFPRNGENGEVTVEYHVEDGEINVSPWPFSVDEHRGYLVAYYMDGYPERLDPFILSYRLKRG
ncbi:MAG: hypothetical protein EDM79_13865 [Chloroflexi bacterium]|nr:MAG: hypothetical protein EDM79_13865 [Chloroflexota bacterium]